MHIDTPRHTQTHRHTQTEHIHIHKQAHKEHRTHTQMHTDTHTGTPTMNRCAYDMYLNVVSLLLRLLVPGSVGLLTS